MPDAAPLSLSDRILTPNPFHDFLISVSPQLGMSWCWGLPAALSELSAPKGPESLFFAGPKKSNPKKWPKRLTAWGG
ncbi:hypothetical protein GCM10007901_45380 [Dyella acidisoli]|uniref:Uncharacterized protein n=1 Tax=Dyella acidisoli TaxID=1867834 RepID=A0ABQ5XXW8_9GAMM|nr:hypothetical protein GCM10007901_45380 [Dyella acidisoli]